MGGKSLALSFGNSLTEEVADCVGEFAELGLDSIMEAGLLKDIPFISTAISIYRIGNTIHDRQYVKKLAIFIDEINKSAADENRLEDYREKLRCNEKFRSKELEYVILLVDRYIGLERPRMLAKLYIAYLDSIITWTIFTEYAEILDRLLLSDYCSLFHFISHGEETVTDNDGASIASISRLLSVGFVEQFAVGGQTKRKYILTYYGKKFAEIIGKELNYMYGKESTP